MFKSATALVVLAACAGAQVMEYEAGAGGSPALAPDPVTAGWTRVDPSNGQVVTTGVSPDGATGSNAWGVSDADTSAQGFAFYEQALSPAQQQQAHVEGWELSARMRLVSSTGSTVCVEYSTGTTSADDRWLVLFTISGSDVVATANNGATQLLCVGAMDGGYHTFALHKPPQASNLAANFYYDGNFIGVVPRVVSDASSADGAVRWGTATGPDTARVHFNRVQFTITTAGTPFCYGDGSGAACPCGNAAGALSQEGCMHSGGVGMTLRATGTASIGLDDLVLTAEQCPAGNTGILLVGNQSSPGLSFFDGVQCTFGQVMQLRGLFQTTGTVSDTGIVAQDTTGSYFQPAVTYTFQYASRDVAAGASPCGMGAILSHAVKVRMEP